MIQLYQMSIYVSIASYEDKDLLKTINNCILNASKPDDIVFGLSLSYEEYPDLSNITNKIILHKNNPKTRPGLVKLRNLLKEEVTNEDYFLQIDSHTNFIENWDTKIIEDLETIKATFGNNSIISKRVSDKVGVLADVDSDFLKNSGQWVLRDSPGLTLSRLEYNDVSIPLNNNQYSKTNYASCHFLFGDNSFTKKVKFDHVSHFIREEVFLSFLIYIQGYDIYQNNIINHIGHDPFRYNKEIYQTTYSQDAKKTFVSKINEDSDYYKKHANDFILNGNNNIYNGFNFVRSPKDFWNEIKLSHLINNND